MTLFELVAKISADTTAFDSAVGKAEKSGKSLSNSLSANMGKIKAAIAGALTGAAIKRGIDGVINLANAVSAAGDKIDKQSQALGLSRKAYQEWDYILGQNGASIDSLGVSMKTLNSLFLSAMDGSEDAQEAFSKLGVDMLKLEGMSMEEQFEAVVRAFQKLPAGAQKSALAVKLFGRNGMELLPLLNQSETSIDELRKRAQELGIVMSDDAVDASVAYGDALDDLNRTTNGLRYSIGAKFLPILTNGIQQVTGFIGRMSTAFQENGLQGLFTALGAEIDGFITDLKNSDSPVLQFVGSSLETVKTVFNWLVENKTGVVAAVTAIIAAFAVGKIAAFVASLNPLTVTFTLIATAIGLVAQNWDKIKDWIGKAWETTVTFVQNGWAAIQSAFDTVSTWVGDTATKIKLAFTATVADWISTIQGWLDGTGLTDIALNIGATVADWISTIQGWLDGTGISDIALNIGATVADWISTIGAWLDGTGVTDFTMSIGATVSEWIKRIYDWITNGVTIALNFLSNTFGADQGSYSVGEQTYPDPLGVMNGIKLDAPIPIPGHASGLGSVPYDNYLARLHRGEQVLTASQARQRRDRNSGLDLSALVTAVTGAIRDGMDGAVVDSYLDGRNVSDGTNRRTMNRLRARRFAT